MKKIILLSILFSSLNCFAVSSGTFTVNQWGTGNYTTLQNAETGLQGVLISTCYIIITGSWTVVDSAVAFGGWTTFSTAPVVVQAQGLARHAGLWDTTKYNISATGDYTNPLGLNTNIKNIIIDGLQIEHDGVLLGSQMVRDDTATHDRTREISNCIIRSNYNSTGILNNAGNNRAVYKIWNNIIQGMSTGINGSDVSVATSYYIYNNTIINSSQNATVGMYFGATFSATISRSFVYIKNNIVQYDIVASSSYVWHFLDSGVTATSTTNVANDNKSPNPNYINQISSFVNYAGNNYHLLANDTTSYQRGVDLSADAVLPFTTDIDGETRPTAWSIGADDIPTATPSTQRRKRIRRAIVME